RGDVDRRRLDLRTGGKRRGEAPSQLRRLREGLHDARHLRHRQIHGGEPRWRAQGARGVVRHHRLHAEAQGGDGAHLHARVEAAGIDRQPYLRRRDADLHPRWSLRGLPAQGAGAVLCGFEATRCGARHAQVVDRTVPAAAERIVRGALFAAAALAAALVAPAHAADVRVGKSNPTAFTFTPIDIGKEYGIFQKHGLNLEVSTCAGATRIHQGMAADQVDIGLASGPDMVFVAKGSPVKAVANMAGPPALIGLGVRLDGSIPNVADLKGKTVGVTTLGSLTWWLTRELSKKQGWGPEGIKSIELGTDVGMVAALKTKQIDGIVMSIDAIYTLESKNEAKPLVNF